MSSPDARVVAKAIEEGLSKIAHSIRRTEAMHMAISITEPGTPMEEVYLMADEISKHIAGKAQEHADEQTEHRSPMPWQEM